MLRHEFRPAKLVAGLFLTAAGVVYLGDAGDAWETPWFVVIPLVVGGLCIAGAVATLDHAIRGRRGAGRMGPTGPMGPMGPTGMTDTRGPVGPVGPTGPVGATGPEGAAGATGRGGPAGPTEAKRATGAGGSPRRDGHG